MQQFESQPPDSPEASDPEGLDARQPAERENEPGELRYVVALGASAGGLEALEEFFTAVRPGAGMAYVVIQHLSPDYASRMDELLSRHTSLRVKAATHGEELEADCVYLGVAGKEMIVSGRRLLLTDRNSRDVFTLPIDHFFRSLAHDFGERAVGIVLSGTGSDGTRGLRELHEAKALTICQPPENAKFSGMPRSALDSGVVDLVLAPHQIPRALLKHARLVSAGEETHAERPVVPSPRLPIEKVVDLLHRDCGVDFGVYKPSTVNRRIERRQQLAQKENIEEYAKFLEGNREELDALCHDLLIGVTQFFRDKKVYEELSRRVIVPLIREKKGQEIRVWVAGCATGEEAYSMAIAFREAAAGRETNETFGGDASCREHHAPAPNGPEIS